ncbi:protein PSK SIMULATOR 3-like [Phragmites australis]|uniref:protein PSK SIMULATOR 3-like n=1 Tax=Phragmites australis TaxID=29695 RepID=UPI002D7951F4|nr:protein PSK SIMULATOR 3-like [Phragmites australis]
MRKLSVPRGGGERVGVLAFEVAALMSRAAALWRALGDAQLAHLRGEAVRLEGVRRLVADDDAVLLALALAEVAGACRSLSHAVARLSARCADPLLRRFDALFAALVKGGAGADLHGLRYAADKKMDRKARKMQRLVAFTAHLCHELDVLAELEQGLRRGRSAGGEGECARRVARQRQEVERLRAVSLWNRSFDHVVRLLARSLFTIVTRIIEVFDLEPMNTSISIDDDSKVSRLSWSNSFVGSSMQSMVYPSDVVADTARRMLRARSGKITSGDARRFLMSRSKSLRQLNWPAAGKHLIGCVISGSKSPVRNGWIHAGGDLPLSFSYVSASNDNYNSINFQFQADHTNAKPSTSVFESSHDVLTNAPEASLGAAALALHYANLIIFIEKLAISPHHVCSNERDALYSMLTDRMRASLRARLRPFAKNTSCDPTLVAEWSDTVQRILGWLAPLARNMIRWQAERNFEQRNVASGASVLLLQTLHFADQKKTEDAVTELLVCLNYLWRSGRELETKAKLESAGRGNYDAFADYVG